MKFLLAALLLVAALSNVAQPAAAENMSNWLPARATFYQDNGQGACHYYNIIPPQWYGAWPDSEHDYNNGGICGKCFMISCVDKTFTDGYGATIDRTTACYDTNKAVVIKIVDICPCNYQPNAYSNARWCCGDMDHIDMGEPAFSQLADTSLGVIGIQYKQVDCSLLGVTTVSGSAPSPAPAPAPSPALPAPVPTPPSPGAPVNLSGWSQYNWAPWLNQGKK